MKAVCMQHVQVIAGDLNINYSITCISRQAIELFCLHLAYCIVCDGFEIAC